MAPHDIDKAYYQLLESSHVIVPGSADVKGFHLLRGWGIELLEQIVSLFSCTMRSADNTSLAQVKLLIPAETYESEVREFGGFEGVYRVYSAGAPFVLRPDAALEGIRELVQRQRVEPGPYERLTVFQGFRSIRGSTPTLFRDRFIFPFVQFNSLIDSRDCDRGIKTTIDKLLLFFNAICIPVRIVDFGPWKKYGRRLFAAVTHSSNGEPTILAMFFIVGDVYRKIANVPVDVEAFDIGITQKILATILLAHRTQGLRLPSSIAPVQLAVHESAAGLLDSLPQAAGFRIKVVGEPSQVSFKLWVQRRGVPLFITADGRNPRIFCGRLGWRDYDDTTNVSDLLQLWDSFLLANAFERVARNARPSFFLRPDETEPEVGREIVGLPSFLNTSPPCQSRRYWPDERVFY